MKTIMDNLYSELVINKSKFITNIIKVNNKDDIIKQLSIIKNKYSDATHNCYAYICDNLKKCNDDSEPSKTAGMPILTILEHENLNHVLCVVTRYFGGIKLGTGGLVRAYSNSVKKCLDKAIYKDILKGFEISLTFEYEKIKIIDYLLKNCLITNKIFDDNITYVINISSVEFNNIQHNLNNFCKINSKKNIFI